MNSKPLRGGGGKVAPQCGGSWKLLWCSAGVRGGAGKLVPFVSHLLSPPQVLPCLLRPFSHVLYHLPLGTVTSLVQQLTNLPQRGGTTAPPNPHLTAVLQNKVLTPPQVVCVSPPSSFCSPKKCLEGWEKSSLSPQGDSGGL